MYRLTCYVGSADVIVLNQYNIYGVGLYQTGYCILVRDRIFGMMGVIGEKIFAA